VIGSGGHLATPWELRPWEHLRDRFDVAYLRSASNQFDNGVNWASPPSRPPRSAIGFPGSRLSDIAVGVIGDRYLGSPTGLAGADVVHAEELSFWFAAGGGTREASTAAASGWSRRCGRPFTFSTPTANREAKANRRAVLEATASPSRDRTRCRGAALGGGGRGAHSGLPAGN